MKMFGRDRELNPGLQISRSALFQLSYTLPIVFLHTNYFHPQHILQGRDRGGLTPTAPSGQDFTVDVSPVKPTKVLTPACSGFESLLVLMFLARTLPNNSGWLLSPELGMKDHHLVSESHMWGSIYHSESLF